MPHFVRAICFAFIFVGLWVYLCQSSSLGLEPIFVILFIYFIESLSHFVLVLYFCFIPNCCLCLNIISSCCVVSYRTIFFVIIFVYVKCRSILIKCCLVINCVSWLNIFRVKFISYLIMFHYLIYFVLKCRVMLDIVSCLISF